MSAIDNLRSIVKDWGDKTAAQFGTSCQWIDLYAENPDMSQYQKYRVTVWAREATYTVKNIAPQPEAFFTKTFVNRGSAEIINTHSANEETTHMLSWSLSEGIDVGTQLNVSAPIPIGLVNGTISTNISLSSTQEWQKDFTQYWGDESQITIPPRKKLLVKFVISREKYDIDFAIDVVLSGYVAIWFRNKIDFNNRQGRDLHHLWFIPVRTVFHTLANPDFKVVPPNVLYTCRGKFKGVQGISSFLDIYESDVSDEEDMRRIDANEPLRKPDWIIPLVGPQVRPARPHKLARTTAAEAAAAEPG